MPPEPRNPEGIATTGRPATRYAVLRHEGVPDPHFDVLFERAPGSPLVAFRSPAWPVPAGGVELTALPDHRGAYLDYEGPVSGGRGHVRRVAGGACAAQRVGDDGWEVELSEPAVRLRLARCDGGRWRASVMPS